MGGGLQLSGDGYADVSMGGGSYAEGGDFSLGLDRGGSGAQRRAEEGPRRGREGPRGRRGPRGHCGTPTSSCVLLADGAPARGVKVM